MGFTGIANYYYGPNLHKFSSVDDITDVEAKGYYKELLEKRENKGRGLGKKVRKAYQVDKGFELVFDSARLEAKQRLNSYETRNLGKIDIKETNYGKTHYFMAVKG